MKRCGMKQRATLTAGIAILALLPTPSGATVLEFDESGAVSKKLSVNYIQRARLRENQANEKPSVITVPVVSSRPAELRINAPYNLEHIMNNIIYENASSFPSPSSAISSHTGSTPDAALDFVARLPSNAITYVEAARVRQPVRKSLARAAGWREQARLVARTHGLPPTLFIALIQAESGFNQEAVSPKGAIGFAQLMPETAAALGVDPNDPYENLVGGARYLAQQLERFGTWPLALAAYNAGPTRVARLGRIPNIAETKAFVARVMTASSLSFNSLTAASK